MREQRLHYGSMLWYPAHSSISFDDDKKNIRSKMCADEGFIQKRHDSSGGLGPVVHTAADQLDHMVYGTATNMLNQGDHDCVHALLMGITGSNPFLITNISATFSNPTSQPLRTRTFVKGSQTPASMNLGGAVIYIDRGYAQENLKNSICQAHGHHSGSQPRPQNPETFPWTFGHPEKLECLYRGWRVVYKRGAPT